jgi:hypothetical protein
MGHALIRNGPGAYQSVLRLKIYPHMIRHIIRDQGRDTNAEVDEHSGAELCRNPLGDDILCVQGVHVLRTK